MYSLLGATGFEGVLVISGLRATESPLRQLWDSVQPVPPTPATHACMSPRSRGFIPMCEW